MESSTLLSVELAKRNKTGTTIEPLNNLPTDNSNGEAIVSQKMINECESEWKMALYQSSGEIDDHKPAKIDNCRTQFFLVASDDIIQQEAEDSAKMGTHSSNASSFGD